MPETGSTTRSETSLLRTTQFSILIWVAVISSIGLRVYEAKGDWVSEMGIPSGNDAVVVCIPVTGGQIALVESCACLNVCLFARVYVRKEHVVLHNDSIHMQLGALVNSQGWGRHVSLQGSIYM